MSETVDTETMKKVMEHWIKHNHSHAEDFNKWANRAKSSGYEDIADKILQAESQMSKANEILEDAMRSIGGG